MTRDKVMELANSTAGHVWMDEAHIQRFAQRVAAAEHNALREAAQMALGVLEDWDDLIGHQYTGSSAAMTDMHYAAQATVPAMDALREALGDGNA